MHAYRVKRPKAGERQKNSTNTLTDYSPDNNFGTAKRHNIRTRKSANGVSTPVWRKRQKNDNHMHNYYNNNFYFYNLRHHINDALLLHHHVAPDVSLYSNTYYLYMYLYIFYLCLLLVLFMKGKRTDVEKLKTEGIVMFTHSIIMIILVSFVSSCVCVMCLLCLHIHNRCRGVALEIFILLAYCIRCTYELNTNPLKTCTMYYIVYAVMLNCLHAYICGIGRTLI